MLGEGRLLVSSNKRSDNTQRVTLDSLSRLRKELFDQMATRVTQGRTYQSEDQHYFV